MAMIKVSQQEYDRLQENDHTDIQRDKYNQRGPDGVYEESRTETCHGIYHSLHNEDGDLYEVSEELHEAWFDYLMTCAEEANQEEF